MPTPGPLGGEELYCPDCLFPAILLEMRWNRLVRLVLLFHAGALLVWGGLFGHPKGTSRNHASAITLRKRLHVNPLITPPDTMEVEWGVAVSTDGSFTLPTVIHFTPEGSHIWWGRTEFSASFDSLSSTTQPLGRVTHFGD